MSNESPIVDFPAGSAILTEGEAASALYIIESGKVAILRADAPGVLLAELGPGEFFGEMSILQEQPHNASVVARTAVRALRIDVAAFHGVLHENIEVAVLLMRRLVLRLRASEQRRLELEAQVARLAAKGVAPPPRGSDTPTLVPGAPVASSTPTVAVPATPTPVAPAAPITAPSPATPPAATPHAFALRTSAGLLTLPADKTEFLIGRQDPATGALPEVDLGALDVARSLSRRHARLMIEDGALLLCEEPGVGNGTWVNGGRLMASETVLIQAGDALRFGAVDVQVERV